MPFVPAPGVIRVTVNMQIGGVVGKANVIYFATTSPTIDAAVLADLALALRNEIDATWKPQTPTTVLYTGLTLRSMETEIAPILQYTTGFPITGTLSGTDLPNNVSFAIKLDGGLTGRSTRGRLYWNKLIEADVTGNLLAAVRANAIRDAINSTLILIGALFEYEMQIVSFVSNGAPRVSALVTPVQAATYSDLQVDTQRRRLG